MTAMPPREPRPPGRQLHRLAPLALSVAATAALLAVAAGGLARAASQTGTPYLGVGLAAAEALPGGAVRLVLDVANEQEGALAAKVAVTAEGVPAAGPGASTAVPAPLWSGTLEAPAEAEGRAIVEVPGACGRRLTVTLDAAGVVRSLGVLVPCAGTGP